MTRCLSHDYISEMKKAAHRAESNGTFGSLPMFEIKCPVNGLDMVSRLGMQYLHEVSCTHSAARLNNISVQVMSREDLISLKRPTIHKLTEEARKHENDLQCLEAV